MTSFGILADTIIEARTLSSVKTAALSSSGRYLAIADRAPPFLRVLDRRTGAAWAFGHEGRGPGELIAAHAVEFHGDSIIVVLGGGQRLDRFSVSGEWRGGERLVETGLKVSSITVACAGRVYAYGVPVQHRQLDTVPWVHEMDLDPTTAPRARLRIPGTGYRFGYGGALYGFDGGAKGVLLWHRAKAPHVGYWLPCDDEAVEIWSHGGSGRNELQAAFELTDDRGGVALTLPDTLFAGAAVRGSVKMRAHRARQPHAESATTFHVVREAECLAVELLGEWSLHDAHADGLVLSRSEPFPSVEILDWNWFEEKLVPARCAA